MLKRRLHLIGLSPLLLLLPGCATLTSSRLQHISVSAVGTDGNSAALTCTLNNGNDPIHVEIPNARVEVPRSGHDLIVSCQGSSGEAAKATVQSRHGHFEQAMLPLGSIGVAIDHISGRGFDYPTEIVLHVGQDLILAHGDAAHIVESKPIEIAQNTTLPPTTPTTPVAENSNVSTSEPTQTADTQETVNPPVAAVASHKDAVPSKIASQDSNPEPKLSTEIKTPDSHIRIAKAIEAQENTASDETVQRFDTGVLRQSSGITRFTFAPSAPEHKASNKHASNTIPNVGTTTIAMHSGRI